MLLQGGANDLGQGDVAAAAADVIEQLRSQLPSTGIVLLAPLATGGPQMEAVRESLREVAGTSRVHFVDGSDAGVPARGDLTTEAHATLAEALRDDFELLAI